MATAADIFSHGTPSYFADEAPANSTNIGTRAVNTALDYADALIRARYGDRAGIPVSGQLTGTPGGVFSTTNQGTGSSSALFLVAALLVLFLLMRR